jgi:hypothetical protein
MYYEVTWIEGFEAESHEEAAEMARAFQRDSTKIANHFFIESELGKRREYWDPVGAASAPDAGATESQEAEPRDYHITWEIGVDAGSFREAAAEALRIQRDPQSITTVFTVVRADGVSQRVDLMNPPEPECQPNNAEEGD